MTAAERFVITELTGSQRSISLGGRALPYRGVSWGATMRSKQTWYPGNPRGTLQVLGPQYEPTIIVGCWKARYLVNGKSAIGQVGFPDLELSPWSPDALVAAFYSILNAGNALRVEWRAEVREGILKRFVPTYGRPTGVDVEWEMEFEWSGANDAPAPRAAESPPDPSGELREELNDADSAADARPQTVVPEVRTELRDLQAQYRRGAGSMFDNFRLIAASPAVPLGQISSLIATTELLREEIDHERDAIAGVPRQGITLSDRVSDLLDVERWRRTVSFEQGDLRNGCLRRAKQAKDRAIPGALTVVTVPGDTTLRRLSFTYYGTADEWQRIADVNGFVDSLVPAGTVVVIPPTGAPTEP